MNAIELDKAQTDDGLVRLMATRSGPKKGSFDLSAG